MLITRKERWLDIIDKLEKGAYYGVDRKINRMKGNAFITFKGRKMSVAEASYLSGLSYSFLRNYRNEELTEQELISALDKQWMKEKTKELKQGLR
jgi:hypothetical protein